MKSIDRIIMLCAFGCITAQAQNIDTLNTGAGLYSENTGAVIVDPNWSVTLLGTDPAGQIPPGGIPTGAAYLVPNSTAFPFDGSWLRNTATSSWLSYASPTPLGPDKTDGTYQYQTTFTAADSGVVDINFLDDNTAKLFVNGVDLGSNPNNFSAWLATPIAFDATKGDTYTVDLDVVNAPRDDSRDPTGARVEFSGDVNVGGVSAPSSVPEESSFPVNAALLALPFGASMLQMSRKRLAA